MDEYQLKIVSTSRKNESNSLTSPFFYKTMFLSLCFVMKGDLFFRVHGFSAFMNVVIGGLKRCFESRGLLL